MRYGDSTYTEQHRNVNIPLAEFDPGEKAIIEPAEIVRGKSPSEYCVMPFFGSVIRKLIGEGRLVKIQDLLIPAPSVYPNEVYRLDYEGKTVAVAHPGVGSALAAGTLDELIALGCRKFVACGSSGVLKSSLKRGVVVIPGVAVRDEGTSFHYCPPAREMKMDTSVVRKLEKVLQKHGFKYEIGKTWTTDGFYRETKGKVARRTGEGCIVVDMECSALLAVAAFRKVSFGQYLTAGDDVSGEEWDPRHVEDSLSFNEKVFWLSVEACVGL
jgi:uridine phosphorylase